MIYAVDINMSEETSTLFQCLHSWSGNLTLLGHQDDTVCARDETEGSDVFALIHDYPAVNGFDLGRLELGSAVNIDGIAFADIHKEIILAHRRGGLITLSWHSVNPVSGGGYGHNIAPESVRAVLPGGVRHSLFIGWLERVAKFISNLTDDCGRQIPIIFRPFHEQTGDWFWWGIGTCRHSTDTSSKEYISLWRFTVHYLRDVLGLHNLLYAYSPDCGPLSSSSPEEFESSYLWGYPGDDYVDILGIDNYRDFFGSAIDDSVFQQHDMLIQVLRCLGSLARRKGKIAAATEIGSPGEFAALFPGGAWSGYLLSAMVDNEDTRRVLWYLPWRNSSDSLGTVAYGTPAVGTTFVQDFKKFMSDEFVRSMSQIPQVTGKAGAIKSAV